MPIDAGSQVIVRRGRRSDLEAILDLLTEYGHGRAFFEPRYYVDPTYRPEFSWVAEDRGRIVAHLRVFDRTIRLFSGRSLRVAGVGNVITASAARGQGHAGRLLAAMLHDTEREGFAYSLLWTHLPGLYARYGWAPIRETRVRVSRLAADTPRVTVADDPDLDALAALYDEANRERTGPAIRTRADWRAQAAWTREETLVALEGRTIVAYARHRGGEILDVAAPRRPDAFRALLGAIARRRGGASGRLPPSDVALLAPRERVVQASEGLMGRVIDRAAFRASVGDVVTDELIDDEKTLARLVFHGADDTDSAPLRVRFPRRDFVIWDADAF